MVLSFLSIMHYTIKLSQMRIGVDLDGVVADFTDGWTSQYKKDFGKEIIEMIIVKNIVFLIMDMGLDKFFVFH